MSGGDTRPATAWFDMIYERASGDENAVPWFAGVRPVFADWLRRQPRIDSAQRALVVGCGLGDDAEALASHGYAVTAFDVAPTAVAWCRQRFPQSTVHYVVADLFAAPVDWRQAFDFVLEIFTVQSLPIHLRERTVASLAGFVAPGGALLAIAVGCEDAVRGLGPPWPLHRAEMDLFVAAGLFEDHFETLDARRRDTFPKYRALYRRPVN